MNLGDLGEQFRVTGFEFRNDSGEEIPGFACVRITGMVKVGSRNILTVGKPNTYGSQYMHRFNGPTPVASGLYGVCYLGSQVPALYDTADGTPAFGESWGPRDATWKIKKNTGGWQIVGNSDSTAGVVLVERVPFLRFHGVADSAINLDASGTVSIFYGTGAGTDSTVNMSSVYNSFGNVSSGKDVDCVWEYDVAGTAWKIVAAECP